MKKRACASSSHHNSMLLLRQMPVLLVVVQVAVIILQSAPHSHLPHLLSGVFAHEHVSNQLTDPRFDEPIRLYDNSTLTRGCVQNAFNALGRLVSPITGWEMDANTCRARSQWDLTRTTGTFPINNSTYTMQGAQLFGSPGLRLELMSNVPLLFRFFDLRLALDSGPFVNHVWRTPTQPPQIAALVQHNLKICGGVPCLTVSELQDISIEAEFFLDSYTTANTSHPSYDPAVHNTDVYLEISFVGATPNILGVFSRVSLRIVMWDSFSIPASAPVVTNASSPTEMERIETMSPGAYLFSPIFNPITYQTDVATQYVRFEGSLIPKLRESVDDGVIQGQLDNIDAENYRLDRVSVVLRAYGAADIATVDIRALRVIQEVTDDKFWFGMSRIQVMLIGVLLATIVVLLLYNMRVFWNYFCGFEGQSYDFGDRQVEATDMRDDIARRRDELDYDDDDVHDRSRDDSL